MNSKIVNFIIKYLKKEIKKKGTFNFLICGGNSPLKIYRLLSKEKINWKKVNFFLTDERCVTNKHKHSNERKIRENLILKNIKKYKIYSPIKKFDFKTDKKFDLGLIGMGEDGHFASIFSNMKKYKDIINLRSKPKFFFTEKLGKPFIKRSTMNLSMIANTKKIILLINNNSKAKIFKKIIKSKDSKRWPILNLLNCKKVNIKIYIKSKLLNVW